MTATHTTITISANELVVGDVVLDEAGRRRYVAFDVAFASGADQCVTVYPAVRDQEVGHAGRYYLVPTAPVTVSRRLTGAAVTHTSMVMCEDGSVEVTR